MKGYEISSKCDDVCPQCQATDGIVVGWRWSYYSEETLPFVKCKKCKLRFFATEKTANPARKR